MNIYAKGSLVVSLVRSAWSQRSNARIELSCFIHFNYRLFHIKYETMFLLIYSLLGNLNYYSDYLWARSHYMPLESERMWDVCAVVDVIEGHTIRAKFEERTKQKKNVKEKERNLSLNIK